MKVKFSRCTSSNLAEVPQVDGQLIYTKDTNEVYLDVGNNRNKISDVIMIANKSGVVAPVLNKLYYETSTDTLFKAKIENNNIVWVDITGATVDYVDNNFLKKDNTTAYTPTQNYHPATKKYVDDNCIPYQPFPAGLDTSHTTLNFITSIRALNLPAGSTYLGGVTLTDMPFVGNAEVEIYVYPNNVIYLTLRSANISPYMWECNSHTFRGWEAIDKTAKDYANTNFLKKDNMTAYTPTGDYNPATKQYIDVRYERLKSTLSTTIETGQDITLNKTAELEFVKPPLPMGNSEQVTSILPEGYTQLDYIESTGTQYIDTGYIPVQGDNIKIKDFNFNNEGDGVIFSAGTGDFQSIFLLTPSQSKSYFKWFSSGSAPIIPYDTFSKATIEVIDGTFYLNGEEILQIGYNGEVNTTLNLFRRANETSYINASFSEFIITNNNATKKHYIACRRNSDNAIGLFDIVNNEFVGNSGTGSFTGGSDTVLPNLDYPQEITNVTGDVEVVKQNKNLAWNGWAEDFVRRINYTPYAEITTLDNRNCLKYLASAGWQNYDKKYIFKTNFKENTQYTFMFDMFTNIHNGNICIEYTDGTTSVIQNLSTTAWNNVKMVSSPNKTIKYLRAQYSSGNSWIDLDTFMVYEGTEQIDFIPHKEQKFTFPLGNEKLMLGDYLADDGKHHVRGQRIFDGTESWYAYTDKNTQSYYCYYTNAPSDCIAAQEEANLVKCNVLPESTWDDIYGKRHDTPIIALRDNKRFYVRVPFATVEEWKAYISQQYQNETSVTIEYKLDEEQTVAYTSAQQTVYNQIKQALSYEGQTNISSNQNAIFNVEAYLGTKIILTDYVKKTDYATANAGGVIKTCVDNAFGVSNGLPYTQQLTYNNYVQRGNYCFISKGTLENVINNSIIITGTTEPTTSTVGYRIGQLYLNTTDNKVYQLVSIDDNDSENIIYNWQQIINNTDLANTVGQINSVLDSINGVEV